MHTVHPIKQASLRRVLVVSILELNLVLSMVEPVELALAAERHAGHIR